MKKLLILSLITFSINGWTDNKSYLECENIYAYVNDSAIGFQDDDYDPKQQMKLKLNNDYLRSTKNSFAIDAKNKKITLIQIQIPLIDHGGTFNTKRYTSDLTIPYTENGDLIQFTYTYEDKAYANPTVFDDGSVGYEKSIILYQKDIVQLHRINGEMLQKEHLRKEGTKEILEKRLHWRCKNIEPMF